MKSDLKNSKSANNIRGNKQLPRQTHTMKFKTIASIPKQPIRLIGSQNYFSYSKGLSISWFQKYGTGFRHLLNQVVKPIFFFLVVSLTLKKMDCLTITQPIKIIKTYYKNGDSATATYRPPTQAIGKIVRKF